MVSPSGPRWPGSTACRCCRCRCRWPRGSPPSARRGAWSRRWPPGGAGPDRSTWRVLGTVHLAETREKAIEDCTYGLQQFADYFGGGPGSCRSPTRSTAGRRPRGVRRGLRGVGQRRHRDARRRHRLHRGPARAVGRVRHVPPARPRLGRSPATLESYRLFAREVIPHFQGQLAAPRASHEWATAKRGELFGAGPARPSSTPSPVTSRRRPRTPRRRSGRGGPVMRAAVLRSGEIVVRDDVPDPEPAFGQVLVEVKACGICGSDLHFAKPRRDDAGGERRDGRHARLRRPPPRPRPRRVHGPRVRRRGARGGARHRRGRSGTIVTSVPVLLTVTGVRSRSSTQRDAVGLRRADAPVRALLPEVPNGLDPAAALTEPIAVGLHAVNRSGIAEGEGALVLAAARSASPWSPRCGQQGIEPIVAADLVAARRALAGDHGRPRGRRPAPSRPSTPGRAPAVAGRSWSSRPSACPASSTTLLRRAPHPPASSSSACAWSTTRSRRTSASARS